ncbi:MFS transporter [Janthinobacterium sp. PC23-8]|uniref:MFS transporter n=1 Tax=Janthinobacterium sp. PC23-8 TaxID=2012679 RepID=UPI000B960EA1|nr:hypothetical protein CD932_16520 [Janthinobacterium sp. PC23-8]
MALQDAPDKERQGRSQHSFAQSLKDIRVWLLAAILFSYIIGILGIGVWLPTILKTYRLSDTQVGFATALPYIIGSVAMLLWARILAKSQRYVKHLALTCGLAAIGFFGSVMSESLVPAMLGLTVALIGLSSVRTCFYSIPATFLSREAAAGGLAFINAVGSLGGLFGPYMVGWLKDVTGSFKAGLIGMGSMLVLATVLTLILKTIIKEE